MRIRANSRAGARPTPCNHIDIGEVQDNCLKLDLEDSQMATMKSRQSLALLALVLILVVGFLAIPMPSERSDRTVQSEA